MNTAVRELMAGVIDYAGLFPPAGCDMNSAVRNFAAYHAGEFAWMLGRFVVPANRLLEFESEIAATRGEPAATPWRLSALCGADLRTDIGAIREFNARHTSRFVVDAMEHKAGTAPLIQAAASLIPEGLTAYFELPLAPENADTLQTLATIGARAKVRSGGVTADAFPSSAALARFIHACAVQRVPFKATAGLHHPLRSTQRMTYAADSASAIMHGFLNVFLAACFAQAGMTENDLTALLDEGAADAFCFNDGIRWRVHALGVSQLRQARGSAAIAFGSCSFEEPIQELRTLGLL